MLYELLQNKKARLLFIAIAVVGIIGVIVSIISRPDTLTMTPTIIPYDKAKLQLIGDKIYGYNGAFMYSVGVHSSDSPKIHFSGKLPNPSAIVWASDKGALVNFSGSFINTSIATLGQAQDIGYNESTVSTWYIDFSSGDISFVGKNQIIDKTGYYSAATNRIYYVSTSDFEDTPRALRYYDLSNKTSGLEEIASGLVGMRHLSECPSTTKAPVCLVGSTVDSAKSEYIYAITDRLTELYKADGRLTPTGDPNTYLVLKNTDLPQSNSDDIELPTYSKGHLVNVSNNTSTVVNKGFMNGGFLVGTYGKDKYMTLGNSGGGYATISKGWFGNMSVTNGDIALSEYVIEGMSGNKAMLVNSGKGTASLFGSESSYNQAITKPSDKTASVVSSCKSKSTVMSVRKGSYDFIITDDDNFNATVTAISSCLTKSPEFLLGTSFTFTGKSPVNGKITTD